MQPFTADEIAGMRDTSASALPDTCSITRPSGEPVLNETSGDLEPVGTDVVYVGACRVRPRGTDEQDTQVGDLHETLGDYVGTLPALASDERVTSGDPNDVRLNDTLVVTTGIDSALLGRSLTVVHNPFGSWQIDRRLGLEDREQPSGVEVPS